jgi:ATP-dependent Clp protease ATP-binding subunit ClpC
VFERFTERARQVVVLAQDEARALEHNYIGTEHILLGLLREEEGIAARALERLGVTLDETRAQVAEIIGQGEEPPAGQIPFTPRTKAVLELSLREALALGHNYIGTEHILLGLVRESGGLGARILLGLGADPEQVRGEVIGMLAGPGVGAGAVPDPGWAASRRLTFRAAARAGFPCTCSSAGRSSRSPSAWACSPAGSSGADAPAGH